MIVDSYSYKQGYANGYDDGKVQGYQDGYIDASHDYEHRLAKYWAELHTLNARVSYLERLIDES